MDERVEFVGLDHVQLAAPRGSEGVARNFFNKVLGLQEIPKPANLQKRGGVWFRIGAQELHIGMVDPKEFRPNAKAHPALEVNDIMKLKEVLQSKGVVVRDVETLEYSDRFYSEDPFGNRLEFLQKRSSGIHG